MNYAKLTLLSILLYYNCAFAITDPFKPYLNSIPTVSKVISETNTGAGEAAITSRKFLFNSRNNINTVYAIMSFPQKRGSYPGILVLHGGGSKAEDVAYIVENYARRGYVAMCFDMPGICNNSTTPNSSGPWKSRPGPLEAPRFDIANGLENSTLFDAGVAGIEAFNYLSVQAIVAKKYIGITGYSWGGYSTTFLSGILGSRVKAAYSVFGSGFYDQGSFWKKMISELPDSVRSSWLKYFDAGRRSHQIKAAYFLEAASNDNFFWPEAVQSTLDAVPGTKNHVWDTNLNHKQQPAGPAMQQLYFDYYLKNQGQSFTKAKISGIKANPDSSILVTVKLKIPNSISVQSVLLYYSYPDTKWQDRKWMPIKAEQAGKNKYIALIPASIASRPIDYYAYITDDRSVSVCSDMIFSNK
ncbi:MAG: dienelactone hydrolase family protein [Chitinophagaceae bacterium]